MKRIFVDPAQLLTGILLGLALLMGSTFLALQLEKSSLYRQSQLLRSIFNQDTVGILDMVTEERNVNLLTRFAGAVTSGYINFELIPVHEAKTFAVLFESIGPDIVVDKFEYQRKDLMIYGTAATQESYNQLVKKIRDKDYFGSVSGHAYVNTDDTIQFQILCTANSSGETVLAFARF